MISIDLSFMYFEYSKGIVSTELLVIHEREATGRECTVRMMWNNSLERIMKQLCR